MKKIVLLSLFSVLSWLFAGCEKYEDRTYYDITGVGYVFDRETNQPMPNARVIVMSSFKGSDGGWASAQPLNEYFFTDNNGYFCIKFLKRSKKTDVINYGIWADKYTDKVDCGYDIEDGRGYSLAVENVQNAKHVIQIDTLWIVYYDYGC